MTYKRVIIREFGPPEVLQVIEEPHLPEPKPGEIRVRVLATSAAFTDTMIRKGVYYDVKEKPPFSPGYDMVGVVDKPGGLLIAYGFSNAVKQGKTAIILDFIRFKLMSLLPGSHRKTFYSITDLRNQHPDWFANDLNILFELLSNSKIKPAIWKRMPLSEARQAHELIEQSKPIGKIILEIE